MVKLIVAGGMGAIINCAYSSAFSLELLFRDFFVQPFSAFRTLLPAVLGFLFGTMILLVWNFMRAMAVRFLLDYNGWFLTPKHPINKLWYLLMTALLGKKNLGAFNYQEYLPSLPVPPLGKTCKRYLESVQPLLGDEEFEATKKAVKLFEKKEGRKLQLLLRLKAFMSRNWIHQWWLEYIYLRQRSSITFSSNYFALTGEKPLSPHQLDRAAMCVYLCVEFYHKALTGKVENMTQFQGLVPFCSDGFRYICNTARIPGKEIDRIEHYDARAVKHIVVMRNNKFYKVQVLSSDGHVLAPTGIKKQLEKIMEMAGDDIDTSGVACLTTLDRPTWAQIRADMVKDPVNRDSLHAIDSAHFMLELSNEEPKDLGECASVAFHGDGLNKWSDKCFSIISCKNGHYFFNVEHSMLDATVCAQMSEYTTCTEEYDENGRVLEGFHGAFEFPVTKPTELRWNLDKFEDDLEKAKANLRKMIDDSDLLIFRSEYGKRIPKACKLSPDGWIQMCLQLAYYRMYGKLVQTYESATTRLYYKGRTETIRPVSVHSKAFVETIDDLSIPRAKVKQHLKEAIKHQEKYKFEAMRGLGVDRHLFGLYIIAKWLKMDPMPKMFQDKAFSLSFQLSTSQTPVRITERWRMDRTSEVGGFGTVTDDGYGVSYIVVGEDRINFSIHSKHTCPTTSSSQFAEAIRAAMNDMKLLYTEELGSN